MSMLIPYTVPELEPSVPFIIAKAMASGSIKKGSAVYELEKSFAEYVGTKYAVAFPSARSALFSVYAALGCSGKNVILPSYTCIPAIDAARWAGSRPVFSDIDLGTYNPLFSKNFTKLKTVGAISLSYLYGLVGNLDEFLEFSVDENIPIVEDSAIALGGSYGGKMAGSIGAAGVFSLQESKIITGWRGGIVTTSRKDVYENLISMRGFSHISSPRLAFNLIFSYTRRAFSRPFIYRYSMYALKKIMTSKRFVGTLSSIMSFNPLESINADSPEKIHDSELSRLSNLQAAVALQSMKRIDAIVSRRRKMADALREELDGINGLHLAAESRKSRHAYGRFPIRFEGVNKFKIMKSLLKSGIETSPNYPYICPSTAFMKSFGFKDSQYPNALTASHETLLLPFHTLLTDGDISRIADAVKKVAIYAKRG